MFLDGRRLGRRYTFWSISLRLVIVHDILIYRLFTSYEVCWMVVLFLIVSCLWMFSFSIKTNQGRKDVGATGCKEEGNSLHNVMAQAARQKDWRSVLKSLRDYFSLEMCVWDCICDPPILLLPGMNSNADQTLALGANKPWLEHSHDMRYLVLASATIFIWLSFLYLYMKFLFKVFWGTNAATAH